VDKDPIQDTGPLSGPTLKRPPHSLPFRAIFQEYYSRRPQDLLNSVRVHLNPQAPSDAVLLDLLEQALSKSDKAYTALEAAKQQVLDTTHDTETEELACAEADVPLKRILHDLRGAALCLSGGGIRSASYCLGVLEGLARYSEGLNQVENTPINPRGQSPLMKGLDYLSTVSGGGYIGSWLTAWIFRKGNDVSAYQTVIEAMAGDAPSTSADPDPRTIRHLRDYTSFLAPKLGLSLDTWALAAIVLRNLVVNWIMILPLLLFLVSIPQVIRYAMINGAGHFSNTILLIAAFVLFLVSAITAAVRMPSRQARKPAPTHNREPYVVFSLFVLPIFFASILLIMMRMGLQSSSAYEFNFIHLLWLFIVAAFCFGVIALLLFLSYKTHITKRPNPRGDTTSSNSQGDTTPLLVWRSIEFLGATIVAAFAAALALEGLATSPSNWLLSTGGAPYGSAFVLYSIPMVFAVLLATSSLFSGLLGLFESEIDREWWGRAGGLLIFIVVGWASAFALTIYGPIWTGATWSLKHIITMLAAAVAGLTGVKAGSSGKTSAGTGTNKSSQIGTIGGLLAKYHLVVPALCAIGLLLISIEVAALECNLASKTASAQFSAYLQGKLCLWFGWSPSTILLGHLFILIAASIMAIFFNWFININIFSLHGMYRMRLMRAFLGASNIKRRPDEFVNFDPKDTPIEADLPRCDGVPLHVINSTLNIVGTQDLAWQQRKAESFTFSPVSCGSWRIGYVPTRLYGGEQGLSLATAMAISGAAFNPNMGYHSSPLVMMLMTMFNVRLGCWLPNPDCAETINEGGRTTLTDKGKRFLRKSGPTIALQPMIKEALGKTDSTSRWIELTDGAHFENLALYEMVLRRCHHIVVVDVGADPKYQFEDLGNALRKIEIDLGISIRFEPGILPLQGDERLYCAVARIGYKDADGSAVDDGKLVYIKAGIRGDEPPDIRDYAVSHPTFPHETTANQFFNESQFESYRHLGSYVVDTIVQTGVSHASARKQQNMPGIDMESFCLTAAAYATK